jgi:hypothetical protein
VVNLTSRPLCTQGRALGPTELEAGGGGGGARVTLGGLGKIHLLAAVAKYFEFGHAVFVSHPLQFGIHRQPMT